MNSELVRERKIVVLTIFKRKMYVFWKPIFFQILVAVGEEGTGCYGGEFGTHLEEFLIFNFNLIEMFLEMLRRSVGAGSLFLIRF